MRCLDYIIPPSTHNDYYRYDLLLTIKQYYEVYL